MSTIVYVCTTCDSTWQDGKKVGVSGGETLLETLDRQNDQYGFTIRPVNCMSACSHACCVAFVSPGKYAYLFGNLHPELADSILDCAQIYSNKPDGMMGWNDRPEALKRNLIARLPGF